MNTLIENKGGHGAINRPLRRRIKKFLRSMRRGKLGRGVTVDWTVGSPFKKYWNGKITIKDQGTNYSCSGQAAGYFIRIMRLIQGIDEGEISAKSIYSQIAYPGGGTTIDSLENKISYAGCNLEKDVPSYDTYGNPLPEYLMTDKSWITPNLTVDAQKRAGYTVYDCHNDIDSVASVIAAWGAVIWQIEGQDGHVPGWNSATPQPPIPDNGQPIFSHFMCAYDFGLDANGNKVIYALQSEGKSWGINGIQQFGVNYFNGVDLDAITFIYDKNLQPIPSNNSLAAMFVRWFRSLSWFFAPPEPAPLSSMAEK